MLDFLLERYLPRLHKRVREMDFDIAIISLPWMLTLFVDAIPMEVRAPVAVRRTLTAWQAAFRTIDCLLSRGVVVLFQVALALFKVH